MNSLLQRRRLHLSAVKKSPALLHRQRCTHVLKSTFAGAWGTRLRVTRQSEPQALEAVAKVSLTLTKAGRGAQPCAHKPLFVNGL